MAENAAAVRTKAESSGGDAGRAVDAVHGLPDPRAGRGRVQGGRVNHRGGGRGRRGDGGGSAVAVRTEAESSDRDAGRAVAAVHGLPGSRAGRGRNNKGGRVDHRGGGRGRRGDGGGRGRGRGLRGNGERQGGQRDSGGRGRTAPTPAIEGEVPDQRRRRITQAEKQRLHAHFKSKKYQRNTRLPSELQDAELHRIIRELGLNIGQVSYQLRQWKMIEFEGMQKVLHMSTDEIEQSIQDCLSRTPEDFVADVLLDVVDSGKSKTGGDLPTESAKWFASLSADHRYVYVVEELSCRPADDSLRLILSQSVSFFTETAAAVFPKAAKMLDDAELAFFEARKKRRLVDCRRWSQLKSNLESARTMDSVSFRKLHAFLEDCLYLEWSRMANEEDEPPIVIPDGDRVNRYAEATLYYSASWTLQRASLAKTIARKQRRPFQDFAAFHNILQDSTKSLLLPSSVVDWRETKSFFRASKAYYLFARRIESIFIANFTLRMMLGYACGGLVAAIERAILADVSIQDNFFDLCEDIPTVHNEETALGVLRFLLRRYARMRGRWFVKSFVGKSAKSFESIDKAATRTKVASKAACSKAAANARDVQAFCEAEEELVQSPADADDNSEVNDSDAEDDDSDGSLCSDGEDE